MNFLFLCTGNSCRSILSEALFNERAPNGFKACSAGSKPTGKVHPLTLKTLEALAIDTNALSSKTMKDCTAFNPQVVITVCSSAAQESCPAYLGKAMKAHWGLEDPSHLDMPEVEKLEAFMQTVEHINRRLDAFFDGLKNTRNQADVVALINAIGKIE